MKQVLPPWRIKWLVDVAFRSLRAYIKTLEKPARVKLGDGVIMKAQSYIKQAGANRILDIRFVRIFEQKEADVKKPEENEPEKEHPKENESGKKKYTEGETILIVEMKAWGLLRVDSLDDDEICIKRGQALPTQTTFGGHAAKHVSQVGKYATDADCDTVVLMDLGHMEVFSFNEMERAKPGSGKKTKIGRGCIKTRFTNVNEHRRALTGVLLAAYQDLPRLDAYIPPTTPLSELDLNATSGPSAPDRVEIRRSDRIANSAGPSRTASPRPNPSGTSSRDASPLPPSLVHRSKQMVPRPVVARLVDPPSLAGLKLAMEVPTVLTLVARTPTKTEDRGLPILRNRQHLPS